MGDLTRFWLALTVCIGLPTFVGLIAVWEGVDFRKAQGTVTIFEVIIVIAALVIILMPRSGGR